MGILSDLLREEQKKKELEDLITQFNIPVTIDKPISPQLPRLEQELTEADIQGISKSFIEPELKPTTALSELVNLPKGIGLRPTFSNLESERKLGAVRFPVNKEEIPALLAESDIPIQTRNQLKALLPLQALSKAVPDKLIDTESVIIQDILKSAGLEGALAPTRITKPVDVRAGVDELALQMTGNSFQLATKEQQQQILDTFELNNPINRIDQIAVVETAKLGKPMTFSQVAKSGDIQLLDNINKLYIQEVSTIQASKAGLSEEARLAAREKGKIPPELARQYVDRKTLIPISPNITFEEFRKLNPLHLSDKDAPINKQLESATLQIKRQSSYLPLFKGVDNRLQASANWFFRNANELAGKTDELWASIPREAAYLTSLIQAFGAKGVLSDQDQLRMEGAIITQFDTEGTAKAKIRLLEAFIETARLNTINIDEHIKAGGNLNSFRLQGLLKDVTSQLKPRSFKDSASMTPEERSKLIEELKAERDILNRR